MTHDGLADALEVRGFVLCDPAGRYEVRHPEGGLVFQAAARADVWAWLRERVRAPEPTPDLQAVALRPAVAWTCPTCEREGLAPMPIATGDEAAEMTARLLTEQGRPGLDPGEAVEFYVAPRVLCCEGCKTWVRPEVKE